MRISLSEGEGLSRQLEDETERELVKQRDRNILTLPV